MKFSSCQNDTMFRDFISLSLSFPDYVYARNEGIIHNLFRRGQGNFFNQSLVVHKLMRELINWASVAYCLSTNK